MKHESGNYIFLKSYNTSYKTVTQYIINHKGAML